MSGACRIYRSIFPTSYRARPKPLQPLNWSKERSEEESAKAYRNHAGGLVEWRPEYGLGIRQPALSTGTVIFLAGAIRKNVIEVLSRHCWRTVTSDHSSHLGHTTGGFARRPAQTKLKYIEQIKTLYQPQPAVTQNQRRRAEAFSGKTNVVRRPRYEVRRMCPNKFKWHHVHVFGRNGVAIIPSITDSESGPRNVQSIADVAKVGQA